MKKQIYHESGLASLRHSIVPLLFTLGIVILIMIGLNETERSSRAEGMRVLEESLWRAIITCYAIEGHYPATLEHIENVYGVHIDRTRYVVVYDIMMQNVTPTVTVIDIKSGG